MPESQKIVSIKEEKSEDYVDIGEDDLASAQNQTDYEYDDENDEEEDSDKETTPKPQTQADKAKLRRIQQARQQVRNDQEQTPSIRKQPNAKTNRLSSQSPNQAISPLIGNSMLKQQLSMNMQKGMNPFDQMNMYGGFGAPNNMIMGGYEHPQQQHGGYKKYNLLKNKNPEGKKKKFDMRILNSLVK